MHPALPTDPLAAARNGFAPAARRTATVFGAPVELVWLPERRERRGRPSVTRPPFRRPIAEQIIEREAVWRGGGLTLTPNRYPFADRQVLLWEDPPARDAGPRLLEAVFELAERVAGTGMVNSVGAAASVPRAHAHLTGERMPFLGEIPEEAYEPDFFDPPAGIAVVRKIAPYPIFALGLRGSATARAAAVHCLQMARMTAAWNLVAVDGTTWVFPRSAVETPVKQFPYALGGAEFWGRWCFLDEGPFRQARGEDLEAALTVSGVSS